MSPGSPGSGAPRGPPPDVFAFFPPKEARWRLTQSSHGGKSERRLLRLMFGCLVSSSVLIVYVDLPVYSLLSLHKKHQAQSKVLVEDCLSSQIHHQRAVAVHRASLLERYQRRRRRMCLSRRSRRNRSQSFLSAEALHCSFEVDVVYNILCRGLLVHLRRCFTANLC